MTTTMATTAPRRARRDSEYRRRRRLGWYWSVPTVLAAALVLAAEVAVDDIATIDRILLTLWALTVIGWTGWRWWRAWAAARRYRQEIRRMAREHPGRSSVPGAAPPATLGVPASVALTRVDADRLAVAWNGQVVGTWAPAEGQDLDPDLHPRLVGWDGPVPSAAATDVFSADDLGFSSGTIAGVPYLWCERRRLLVDASGREWPLDALLGRGRDPRSALRTGTTELPLELGAHGAAFVLQAALHIRRHRRAAWLRVNDADSNWFAVVDF